MLFRSFLNRCVPVLLFDIDIGCVDASIGSLDYISSIYDFMRKWFEKNADIVNYKYGISTSSFSDFELEYKRDLFGNYKKKEYIDHVLKNYLDKNNIYEKRVIFDTEGYVAEFTIETNVKPDTLIFEIYNNSLEGSKLDGKMYRKI